MTYDPYGLGVDELVSLLPTCTDPELITNLWLSYMEMYGPAAVAFASCPYTPRSIVVHLSHSGDPKVREAARSALAK